MHLVATLQYSVQILPNYLHYSMYMTLTSVSQAYPLSNLSTGYETTLQAIFKILLRSCQKVPCSVLTQFNLFSRAYPMCVFSTGYYRGQNEINVQEEFIKWSKVSKYSKMQLSLSLPAYPPSKFNRGYHRSYTKTRVP